MLLFANSTPDGPTTSAPSPSVDSMRARPLMGNTASINVQAYSGAPGPSTSGKRAVGSASRKSHEPIPPPSTAILDHVGEVEDEGTE